VTVVTPLSTGRRRAVTILLWAAAAVLVALALGIGALAAAGVLASGSGVVTVVLLAAAAVAVLSAAAVTAYRSESRWFSVVPLPAALLVLVVGTLAIVVFALAEDTDAAVLLVVAVPACFGATVLALASRSVRRRLRATAAA
jgi:hypothetical protein